MDDATRERDFMRLIQHRFIVRLFATFQSQDSLHFCFEFCAHGDLVDWVRRDPLKKRCVQECVVVVRQLVEVVRFMHEKNYCHRDIKRKFLYFNLSLLISSTTAENILLGSDNCIRLADFATSHVIGTKCALPFAGSPQYIAPEIIRGFTNDLFVHLSFLFYDYFLR